MRGSASLRRVPLKALYFAADMSVDEAKALDSATTPPAEDDTPPPPVPITIRARTSGEAQQGYWGRCIHDMAGYLPPTGPIPLNFNHDRDNLIGVIPTAPAIVDGQLVAAANLVPFTDEDQAAEIIYKGSQGVPYQASVQLDLPTLVVEEIGPNLTVEVNGQSFEGPLIVFRQWGLAAISICPFGADSNTSVEFSRGDEFDVACFSAQGTPPMADTPPTDTKPDEKPPEPSAFAAWAKENFAMDEAQMTDEQKTKFAAAFAAIPPKEEAKPVEHTPAAKPDEKPTVGDFAATAKRMLTDFGSPGAVWAAEGKTYDEAAGLFRADQTAQLAELQARVVTAEKERDDLAKKGNFHRGHATPAAFQPPVDETANNVPNTTDFSGFSPSRQSLIAAIAGRLKTSAN